ncbi:hypothetical protein FKM82_007664 [Ascaphus truei]
MVTWVYRKCLHPVPKNVTATWLPITTALIVHRYCYYSLHLTVQHIKSAIKSRKHGGPRLLNIERLKHILLCGGSLGGGS